MTSFENILRRPWQRRTALGAVAFAIAILTWWPMIAAFPNTQGGDGPVTHLIVEATRVSVARYHEFPMWNPYQCHGLPLWDNPDDLAASPLMWLSLLFGTTATISFWVVFHTAVGFAAMWLLARRELKLGPAAAFVASAIWAAAGNHAHQYAGGHHIYGAFHYFPLGVLLWRRAEYDMRAAIGLGAMVSIMLYEAAVYPVPHLMIILGFETLTRIRSRGRFKKIALAAAVVGLVALSLSASRLLPVIDQLRTHKRPIDPDTDALQWATFRDMFLSHTHSWRLQGQQYVWAEYGSYAGPVVLSLAALGLVAGGMETPWLVVILLAALALMAGHQGDYAPWSILHGHVPVFKELRVPSRFRASVIMTVAAFAGIAVDRFGLRRLRAPSAPAWSRALGGVIVLAGLWGAVDIIAASHEIVLQKAPGQGGFLGPPFVARTPAPRLYEGGGGQGALIEMPEQNREWTGCWDEWGFGGGAPTWQGDVPQARASNGDATVESVERTQNKFKVVVDAKAPTRILLNSAYDRGWQTDIGTTAQQSMLLVVDVPAGHHTLHVEYWPRWFNAGVVLNILGIIGTALLWRWDAKRRARPAPAAAVTEAAVAQT